jgi:ribonuclease T1
VALVLLAWVLGHGAFSGAGSAASSAPPTISATSATSLPLEARQTLALIESGGPFPYDQDGVVFENREGLLPDHDSGYYHEYTVPTPGSPDRGARRIITGSAGELYYTDDHYRSFERISR